MEQEFRLLKTFQNPIDANIAKGLLEANGIEAFIFDENTLSVDPILTTALGGIRLLVRSSDFESAHSLLNEVEEGNHKEELMLKCPSCNSSNIKIISKPNWTAFLIMLFSFASTPNAGNTKKYKCKECNNTWGSNE